MKQAGFTALDRAAIWIAGHLDLPLARYDARPWPGSAPRRSSAADAPRVIEPFGLFARQRPALSVQTESPTYKQSVEQRVSLSVSFILRLTALLPIAYVLE
jgi:hypothetical protein